MTTRATALPPCFAALENKAIRRGSFDGVGELVAAIHNNLDATNQDPTSTSGPRQRRPFWKRG